jgi:hypothetical protein
MNRERRHNSRKILEQSSYINIETISGGIVLNASETGLAFQAVAPVMRSGHVRFTVSPYPEEIIDLFGEIVWLEGSGKHGGVRFIEVGEDSLRQVRAWLTQTAGLEMTCENRVLPSIGRDVPAGQSRQAKDQPELPTRPLKPSRKLLLATLAHRFLPLSRRKDLQSPALRFAHGSRWIYRFGAILLACALLMTPLFVVRTFRSRLGSSLIRFGEKLKGQSDLESHSVGLISPVNETGVSSTSSSGTPVVPYETPASAVSTPVVPIETSASTSIPQGEHPGISQGSPRRRPQPVPGRSPLVNHLWSAVGTGDNAAAILLAELYLTGQGVPKSCEQARILLRVAAKSGNAEAMQRLRAVGKTNCG